MARATLQDKLIIRPITDRDSIDYLTGLLHRGYKILADMGLRYLATHQDSSITRERIADADCFVAELDDTLVGTVTFYMPHRTEGSPWLDRKDVAHFGQFAVEPSLQKSGIGTLLVAHVERHARSQGIRHLALDTAEPATHLIRWYEKLGYRFIEYCDWDVTNYRSVVMSKEL
jgi:GNAT superfamily N-acetyltransferase